MPRLIDDIRRIGAFGMPPFVMPDKEAAWEAHARRVGEMLQNPELPIILADNVSQYYYEASDQEQWDLKEHFPNLAPPYPLFWVEHKFPKLIHSAEVGDTPINAPNARTGVLVFGAKRGDVVGTGIPDEAKWVLAIELYIEWGLRKDVVDGPHGTITLCVDEMGRLLDRPYMQSFAAPVHNDLMRSYMAWLHPTLLTICFLHCKNVTVVDNPIPLKLAKRYAERHGGRKPTAYKTLIIEPLKQILRTQGRSGTVGVARALHICRGQFWDYREGRGLFGKYHQLVWHDSCVRGVRKTLGEKPPAREVEIKV